MDKTDRSPKLNRGRGSTIWQTLNRGTAHFYRTIRNSSLGSFFTCYDKAESRLRRNPRYSGRYRCAPVSPARGRAISAVESSWVVRGLRALFGGLLDCPAAAYGLMGLFYALGTIAIYFIAPRVWEGYARDRWDLFLAIALAVVVLPLLFTKRSLAACVGNSCLSRRLVVDFLGVPRDRLIHSATPLSKEAAGLACLFLSLLGLGTSAANLVLSPWVIPLIVVGMFLVGMVLATPESGVVLFTLMLPLVWLDQKAMLLAVGLILLTWCSYLFKLFLLHRSFCMGLLDRVVLILGGLVFLSGFTGYGIGAESLWQTISLTVCISGYFLIVNLVTTRDLVRRCLVGVSLSVVLVTVLAYIRQIPVENLLWLEGSRAGDAIIEGSYNAINRLSQLWVDHSELFLVLAFAWLYAYMVHTGRFFRKCGYLLLVFADLFLILMTRSISALLCVVIVTVLFLLFMGNRWLSVFLLSLPAVVCGACWLSYFYPVSEAVLTILSRSRLYKSQLVESLWQMVWDHPAGIGVGSDAFAAVYPHYAAPDLGGVTDCGSVGFEILLNYGWAGLLVFAVVLILFLQKSFSTLRYTAVGKDRAMILGGVTSLIGMVIFGFVRSFITSPRVFFNIMLVVALCCAYENLLCEEAQKASAIMESSPRGEDRVLRTEQLQGLGYPVSNKEAASDETHPDETHQDETPSDGDPAMAEPGDPAST